MLAYLIKKKERNSQRSDYIDYIQYFNNLIQVNCLHEKDILVHFSCFQILHHEFKFLHIFQLFKNLQKIFMDESFNFGKFLKLNYSFHTNRDFQAHA